MGALSSCQVLLNCTYDMLKFGVTAWVVAVVNGVAGVPHVLWMQKSSLPKPSDSASLLLDEATIISSSFGMLSSWWKAEKKKQPPCKRMRGRPAKRKHRPAKAKPKPLKFAFVRRRIRTKMPPAEAEGRGDDATQLFNIKANE